MSAHLYIVATPIGNLSDMTDRAKEVLAAVDLILCEDTRVTQKLLSHFAIETHTKSFHQHSSERDMRQVLSVLEDGRDVALVTDAGTPAISDPGGKLVEYVATHAPDIKIIPTPGVSAVITALSVSGFPADKFVFLGFPPHKKKREKYFKEVAACEYTCVFYESSHRITKAIKQLTAVLAPEREVVICRELTKKFETVYRGTIAEIAEMDIREKGEFVVVVSNS